jgi:hypothetical protein
MAPCSLVDWCQCGGGGGTGATGFKGKVTPNNPKRQCEAYQCVTVLCRGIYCP